METDHELESFVQLVLSADVENIKIAKKIAHSSENKALKDYIQTWEGLLKQDGKEYTNPIALATFINSIKEIGLEYSKVELTDEQLDILAPFIKKHAVIEATDKYITKVLSKFIYLEHFIIYNPQECLTQVYFKENISLQKLDIAAQSKIHFNKSIFNCKKLKELTIQCTIIADFIAEIEETTNLSDVYSISNQITSKENKHLLENHSVILQFHSIELLNIAAEAFENEPNYFYYFPNLVHLTITNVFKEINLDFSYLSPLKHLTTLVLEKIFFKKEYDFSLLKLPKLTSLCIGNSIISDLNLYSLHTLSLTYIDIGNCNHEQLSGDQLYNILKTYFPTAQVDIYSISNEDDYLYFI